ncbi:winged helix-turn-helix transcriptional regulator [Aliifodinibius sp. S!AR15-10]|uniref:helix-turn-helix transcriptional regulator n=1 Tax=Aliifodinibius sp. S!AR15-10 TaxID=2950437 RepID=UPI0028635716|nr:winged helix-turn-helix transcriptional regulator [Aliifodinibius sp. S!AR15-10]MDR8390696.1 winged helix-turn-helix transcriptional regulator [Aliifodinibius sp. S!AR15-10]
MFTGSKKELLDLIKRNGAISIDDAVDVVELAKTTVREHFLQLERDGYIQRDYVRSGPGRPSLQYQMTQKGNSLFPSSESAMVRELLKYLKQNGEEKTIEDFFETFWDQRIEKARRRMDELSHDGIQAQVEALMKMLEEEGFMPEFNIDEESEALTVKECNCPFSEVVKETKLPCKLEAMFYKKLFERDVERTSYIAEGDYSCTYDISLKAS